MRMSAAIVCVVLAASGAAAQTCAPYWGSIPTPGIPGYPNTPYVVFDDGTGPTLYVLEFPGYVYRWRQQGWELLPRTGLPDPPIASWGMIGLNEADGPSLFARIYSDSLLTYRWRHGEWSVMPESFWPPDTGIENWPMTTADLGDGVHIYGKINRNVVVRWNGLAWEHLGEVSRNPGTIDGMIGYGPGKAQSLYVFGQFDSVDGVPARGFAKWDGTSWSGPWPGVVTSGEGGRLLTVYDDGTGPKLYSNFKPQLVPGGVPRGLYRWDGDTWEFVGGPDAGQFTLVEFHGLHIFDDGSGPGLYVTGVFRDFGGVPAKSVVRYDGKGFHTVPGSEVWSGTHGYGVIRDERGESLLAPGPYINNIETFGLLVGCHSPTCQPNCDLSEGPKRLNVNDFVCFINKYAALDPYANCNVDSVIDINDFACFMGKFAQGCP